MSVPHLRSAILIFTHTNHFAREQESVIEILWNLSILESKE